MVKCMFCDEEATVHWERFCDDEDDEDISDICIWCYQRISYEELKKKFKILD